MDETLKRALDFANYRKTLESQIKILKDKLQSNLTIGHDGGIFYIDSNLINFIDFLIRKNRLENVPVLDVNQNPILIKDVSDFMDKILDAYFASTTDYILEFEKLKKQRTVSGLVDL